MKKTCETCVNAGMINQETGLYICPDCSTGFSNWEGLSTPEVKDDEIKQIIKKYVDLSLFTDQYKKLEFWIIQIMKDKDEYASHKLSKFKKELKEKNDRINELGDRLFEGRDYLMQIKPSNISIEDTLEALGYGRNGLKFD